MDSQKNNILDSLYKAPATQIKRFLDYAKHHPALLLAIFTGLLFYIGYASILQFYSDMGITNTPVIFGTAELHISGIMSIFEMVLVALKSISLLDFSIFLVSIYIAAVTFGFLYSLSRKVKKLDTKRYTSKILSNEHINTGLELGEDIGSRVFLACATVTIIFLAFAFPTGFSIINSGEYRANQAIDNCNKGQQISNCYIIDNNDYSYIYNPNDYTTYKVKADAKISNFKELKEQKLREYPLPHDYKNKLIRTKK